MTKYLLAALLLFQLIGCAVSSGVKVDPALLEGLTTEAQVLQVLGPPTQVLHTPEGKVLIYSYLRTDVRAASFIPIIGMMAGGTDSVGGSVAIYLNPDGTIKATSNNTIQSGAR